MTRTATSNATAIQLSSCINLSAAACACRALAVRVAERDVFSACVGKRAAQVIYKIDIPANRYDLLCLEGIGMALNVFRQKAEYPMFRVVRASHIASDVEPRG